MNKYNTGKSVEHLNEKVVGENVRQTKGKLLEVVVGIDLLLIDKKHYVNNNLQGKTWLTACFCIVRCILFPGTKIIISAGVKSQSIEVLEKISDLRNDSPMLDREIDELKTGSNDARVTFKNGSWMRCVASTQNGRSKRANIIIVDEYRMVEI